MVALAILIAVLIAAGAAIVAAGYGEPMRAVTPDRVDPGLPEDRPVRARDIPGLRFSLAFRGYRMREVDTALARIAIAMHALEEEVAGLREQVPQAPEAAE